jgi:hypothetical protein
VVADVVNHGCDRRSGSRPGRPPPRFGDSLRTSPTAGNRGARRAGRSPAERPDDFPNPPTRLDCSRGKWFPGCGRRKSRTNRDPECCIGHGSPRSWWSSGA